MMHSWREHRVRVVTYVCRTRNRARRRPMSKDVTAALTRCLQELRLATVRSQYEAVARQATAESWSHVDYLRELVERECQQRRHNRIERLVKASRLALEKSWTTLDLKR